MKLSLWNTFYTFCQCTLPDFVKNSKFKIGDRVRIISEKYAFRNKYKNNWSREIFIITRIVNTNPITYKIKDLNEEDIIGSFYN